MKELNKCSKRAMNFIRAYWNSSNTELRDCYKTHSVAKHNAYVYCKSLQCSEGGWNFKIISYNSMQFTCGWIVNGGDLRIETRDSSYIIKDIELPF